MAPHKYSLTFDADKITGSSGVDIFYAALDDSTHQSTLGSNDILDGRGGKDKLIAELPRYSIDPVMKNIETGIFSIGDITSSELGLAGAAQMASLVFSDTGAHTSPTNILVNGGDHVSSIAVNDSWQNSFELDALTDVQRRSMSLSFDNAVDSTVTLNSVDGRAYSTLDISINSESNIEVGGNAVSAKTLSINTSAPLSASVLTFAPTTSANDTHRSEVRHLIVTGYGRFDLAPNGSLDHLLSVDASGRESEFHCEVGGRHLTSYQGSAVADYVTIDALGGSTDAPAVVRLNKGGDHLIVNADLDPSTQRFFGGKYFDTIEVHGADNGFRNCITNFEGLILHHATGAYDLGEMGLWWVALRSVDSAVSLDIDTRARVVINEVVPTSVTVNVLNAATSDTDVFGVSLYAQLGTASAGFNAPDLSNLSIYCFPAGVMYLGTVGAADDPTKLTIIGEDHLTLNGVNAAVSYISTVTIADRGGADISGLGNMAQAFVPSGATITGAIGDDVLIGGAGADRISTGGGNNAVHGSLGADLVTLDAGSGQDLLVFNNQAQSSHGSAHDTVDNFGASDVIDIGAIADNVAFVGNFADNTAGEAALSSSHASAFFNATDHMLYIDLNHDKDLGELEDMAIQLNGVDSFSGASLLS